MIDILANLCTSGKAYYRVLYVKDIEAVFSPLCKEKLKADAS